MRRYLFFAVATLIVLGLRARPAVAAEVERAARPAHASAVRYVCAPSVLARNRAACPAHGPGTTAERIASIRLPDALPELPVQELPVDEDDELLPRTYAHVNTLPQDVYHHPAEAAEGLPPVRTMLSGAWWVTVHEAVEYEGETWYRINPNEYVRAGALSFANPSRFQGVYLYDQPQLPFAWMNRWFEPRVVPQGAVNGDVSALHRYQRVTIYAEERRGTREIWYLVGPDQWVEQSYVSKVTVSSPPPEVGPGEKWIEVDLFEQTIAAYEGTRMVYATLISSGRTGTATPPGLYRIHYKLYMGKMSNPDVQDGSPIWYYMDAVPWSMYFHGAYSIHTAYWHDAFGFYRSYGCVNLTPRDAKWFYEWADPPMPAGRSAVFAPGGTWVWVHFTRPF